MEEKIETLRSQGYEPVFVWEEGPDEEDADHAHPYDTRLVILEGSIEVRMRGESVQLVPGDELDIPRTVTHYAKTGKNSCTYIVAEKHS